MAIIPGTQTDLNQSEMGDLILVAGINLGKNEHGTTQVLVMGGGASSQWALHNAHCTIIGRMHPDDVQALKASSDPRKHPKQRKAP